jgi:hypothetical protein
VANNNPNTTINNVETVNPKLNNLSLCFSIKRVMCWSSYRENIAKIAINTVIPIKFSLPLMQAQK